LNGISITAFKATFQPLGARGIDLGRGKRHQIPQRDHAAGTIVYPEIAVDRGILRQVDAKGAPTDS
jgi:hypothetical protein